MKKFNFVKTLLVLTVLLCAFSFSPVTKAYASTTNTYQFNLTNVGEAVNKSTSSSYQMWVASSFQSNSYKPNLIVNTKDIAIKFAWTGSFGHTYVSVDGVDLGSTDTMDTNAPIYFLDIKKSGDTTVKTLVLKNLSSGRHTVTVKAVSTNGTIKTDYANITIK